MKYSIIVPAYNSEKTIKKCIESIIKNNHPDYEIIIVENGSTDKTVQELSKLNFESVRIYNLAKASVGKARNFGIQKAQGDYVLFVDSDDKISSTLLCELDEVLKKTKADIIRFTGRIITGKEKRPIDAPQNLNITLNKEEFYEKISSKQPILTYVWLLVVKRSKIKPFNENLRYLEDLVFYVDNIDKSIFIADIDAYEYFDNHTSITKEKNNYQLIFNSIEQTYNLLLEKDYPQNMLNLWYENIMSAKILYYVKLMDKREALCMIRNVRNISKEHKNAQSATCLKNKITLFLLDNNHLLSLYCFCKIINLCRGLK